MPDKHGDDDDRMALERARRDAAEGKSASTQAGEFVKEEIDHVREGKHGARSAKQAIAIGLSKARRLGVDLPPPGKGTTSNATRRQAIRDVKKGGSSPKPPVSRTRSRATSKALRREGRSAATRTALARQARSSAKKRPASARSAAARKAAQTRKKGRP
jgi:hypothetical protein